jgi:hypothetical protein
MCYDNSITEITNAFNQHFPHRDKKPIEKILSKNTDKIIFITQDDLPQYGINMPFDEFTSDSIDWGYDKGVRAILSMNEYELCIIRDTELPEIFQLIRNYKQTQLYKNQKKYKQLSIESIQQQRKRETRELLIVAIILIILGIFGFYFI